jgi:uncharacterized protein
MLKKILAVFIIAVLGLGVFWLASQKRTVSKDNLLTQLQSLPDRSLVFVEIGDQVFKVEVVNTPKSIAKGLSERDEIGSDGMLFVLRHPDTHGFWMLDMQFDLDIIWIAEGKVVGFALNAPKPVEGSKELPIYQPGQPVDLVLETTAGFVDQHQIKIGDELSLIQP